MIDADLQHIGIVVIARGVFRSNGRARAFVFRDGKMGSALQDAAESKGGRK